MQQCIGAIKECKREKKLAAFEERYRNATKAVQEAVLAFIDESETELQNGNIKQLEAEIYCLTKKVVNTIQKVWADNEVAVSDSTSGIRNRVRSIMADINQ